MAIIKELIRKSNILRKPSLPCFSRHYTINLLNGCPYGCLYCYAQSFRKYPRDNSIGFYCNTLEKLQSELPGKHTKPRCVYFSTACEPFIPNENVLANLFSIMKLLLENGISLLISTKSMIPKRFTSLFEKYPELVHIQFGLTTTDDKLRQIIEPNAFPIDDRINSVQSLLKHGVSSEVRMDPLIPGLTDTEKSFRMLCSRIADSGVTEAVISYLFIRGSNYKSMMFNYNGWSFRDMEKSLYTEEIEKYCGKGIIRVAKADYRAEAYERLKKWAHEYGIVVRLCGCKNPDVTNECCHHEIHEYEPVNQQLTLFSEAE